MSKLLSTHEGITITLKRDEGRIDSRIVADVLGIQHESFLRSLEQYQGDLSQFGIFRFEIGKIKGRGRPEKFAMLNEDQFIFAITLSSNTPRVVQAKMAVMKAFSEARRLLQTQNTAYLPAWHDLHQAAQQMQAVADARGSSAPQGVCHIWLEKLNNRLLGKKAGERAAYSPREKALLGTLCQLERQTIEHTLQSGGNDKDAYHAAKSQAQAFMRHFGSQLLEVRP